MQRRLEEYTTNRLLTATNERSIVSILKITADRSGAVKFKRESREIRERSRRCKRGRNPVKPLFR